MRSRQVLPQVGAGDEEEQEAGCGGETPAGAVLRAHEFRGGAARNLRQAGLETLLELHLAGEIRIFQARHLKSFGFRLAHVAGDVLFDQMLIHNPRLSRSRLVKPRSSRIWRKRRRARLSAWLKAASVSCISSQMFSLS